MMKIISLLFLVTLMTGCGQTTRLATGPDHPASAGASEAPVPAASTTLSGRSAPTAPTTPSGGHAHVHGDSNSHIGGASSQPVATSKYTCPHHPEVVADKAGTCPKCKMKLVKKEAGHEGHH